MEVQSQGSQSEGVTQSGSALQPAVNMANDGGEAPAPDLSQEALAPEEAELEAELEAEPESEGDTKEVEAQRKREQEDFARRFAALTRREREFLAREKQVKEESGQLTEVKQKIDNLKNNPLEALSAAGWSFKDLADFVLNDGKLPAEKQQMNTVEELRAEIEALKNERNSEKESEKQSKAEKQIQEFRNNIKSTVSENLDKYELINVHEAYEMVYDVIESHFEQTIDPDTGQGQILDIEVAAEAVEKHLDEQAARALKAKKFASRLRPQDQETPQETTGATAAKIQPSPTLTHRQTTSATPPTQGDYILSDEESKRAAAEFLQKALNNA